MMGLEGENGVTTCEGKRRKKTKKMFAITIRGCDCSEARGRGILRALDQTLDYDYMRGQQKAKQKEIELYTCIAM